MGMFFMRRERRERREGQEKPALSTANGRERCHDVHGSFPSRPSRLSHLSRPSRLSLLLLIACRPAPPAGSLTVVDDAGDTVRLAAPARRVVSLIPATTELLFAIDAGPAVVGRTNYCDFPGAAKSVPNLGDGIKPNLEAVIASRPDLVILYNSGQNAAVTGRLRELGIAAMRLNTDALSSVPRIARVLGKLTGHEKAADSLSAVFDTALASATQPGTGPRPKVLLLVWVQPPMTVGRGSFLNELLERAGGENLFADVAGTDGVVSIEAVAARDPDLIFTTAEGPSAFATRPEWQAVAAVREKRFLHVTGSEFGRPSPRSPMAIRQLSAKLREGGS
jgi:iron complex transport system substrate-binding protein